MLNFSAKTSTRIWHEEPNPDNPYLADKCRLHGYDIYELIKHKSFVDVLYLLFSGNLPTEDQAKLLNKLMVALINIGPRHPACRAAMTAGISKARHVNILPIGLLVLGGEHLGAAEVEEAMVYLQSNIDKKPGAIAKELLPQSISEREGDWHIIPGFGSRFGGIDPLPNWLASNLDEETSCKAISWGKGFAAAIRDYQLGWLNTGITAAILLDLNLKPREGAVLFQLLCAPGILAHGMEQTHHPVTDMPTIEDKDYVIQK